MLGNEQETGMLRPTLVIGGGGTGYDIVVRIKARFHETFPSAALRQIRFLVFDTDTNHPPVRNSVGTPVRLDGDHELYAIGGVPVGSIIDNRAGYPEYGRELELNRLPRLDLTMGARQVRQLGRLAFFFHFQRIQDALRGALRSVLSIANIGRAVDRMQSVNVFYISSTCGGTGSGIMLDLAYLTRAIASSQLGIPVDHIFNTGLFLMPEAFRVPVGNRAQIRANACAMLNEIDYFTEFGGFTAHYPGQVNVNDPNPPFNIAYLVDATNERNLTVDDVGQLNAIMAEALFLQAGSYLGLETQSAFDNVATAMRSKTGFIRSYSMVGAATLRFNVQRMHRACARQLQEALVRDMLLHPLPAYDPASDRANNPIHPGVRERVGSFLSSAYLQRVDLLRAELRKMPDNASMVVQVIDRFANEPRNRMVSRVEAACQRYADTTIAGGFIPQIERNRVIQTQRAQELLRDFTLELIDEPESGLLRAELFLRGVVAALGGVETELHGELDRKKLQATRSKQDLDLARQGFVKAAQHTLLLKQGLHAARVLYLTHFEQTQNNQLDTTVINQGQVYVAALRERANRLLAIVGVMRAALEEMGGVAANDLAWLRRNWDRSYATERNIDAPEDIDRFYDKHRNGSLLDVARDMAADHPPRYWFDRFERNDASDVSPAVALKTWLETYCVNRFDTLRRGENVEDLLLQNYPDESARRQQLDSLIALAAPFSNIDEAAVGMGSDEMNRILVIGLPNHRDSIFRSAPLPDAKSISTFDAHRLSVLDTRHGLPLRGVRQYGVYREHLNRLAAGDRLPSFVCFKAVQRKVEAQRLLALGEALGALKVRGIDGFYLGNDRLGQNRDEVLSTLVTDAARQTALQQRVDKLKQHRDALSRLRDYVAPATGDNARLSLLEQDLRALAAAELASIEQGLPSAAEG